MKRFNITLRGRIFFSMLLIIAVSFFLTGTISFYHFKKENEQYHEERLRRKEYAVLQGIQFFLGHENLSRNTDSIVKMFDNKVCELASINDVDINIYGLKGNLLISSAPSLHERKIIPHIIPSSLLREIQNREEQLVVRTRGDTLDYLTTYDYIRNFENEPVAIINLPYFLGTEEKQSRQDIRNFLLRLSEIYFLLFLAAGFIAYFLSNYITSSLQAIGEMIKNTRISGTKPSLRWKFDDEIGTLVDEYNRMLEELEASAIKLAQTERESAWKEMAKQVAHEIKNPLTPMRLSVQRLQQNLSTSEDAKLKEFSESMVAQIDTLSNIAEAFSRFASLPEMKRQKFPVSEVIGTVASLYPELQVVYRDANARKAQVYADRDQLMRVFTNLLNNARQAIPENRRPELKLTVSTTTSGMLKMAFSDNGVGIPAHQHKKIFQPRFTTKTRGMGLGLALVKRIIDGFEGEIELQSQEEKGSTFTVYLHKY